MSEERLKILTMLSEGKLTPDEAERLLDAVEEQKHRSPNSVSPDSLAEGRFLYVQVEPREGKSSERVSVKVPFALLKAGLNITGLIPKEAKTKLETSMHEKGFDFDFENLNPDNIEEVLTALEQLSVDAETDEATIQVYCR